MLSAHAQEQKPHPYLKINGKSEFQNYYEQNLRLLGEPSWRNPPEGQFNRNEFSEREKDPLFFSYIDLLGLKNPNVSANINPLEIPLSRSPEAPHSDFLTPRRVISGTEINQTSPYTFLGHTRKINELEVISWNPQKKRYDFLLVSDLGSDKVKIHEPSRAVCISCHQNEGPHFTRFPWAETSNSQADPSATKLDIQEAILHARAINKNITTCIEKRSIFPPPKLFIQTWKH